MSRIFVALLIALSLLGSPSPAVAAASQPCPMATAGNAMPADHEDMGCCTTECTSPCPPAALEAGAVQLPVAELFAIPLTSGIATALRSLDPAATDPPPRLRFT